MIIMSDEDVLKECEKLGRAGVRARLTTGHFSTNPTPAYEWLMQRDQEDEDRRNSATLKAIKWTAIASVILAVCAAIGIAVQIGVAKEQSADAKELMAAQISVELDKQFDSLEMRRARKRFASQLLKKQEVSELRVLDFFEKVAMYQHQRRIDLDTVDRAYSYWVERYWLAAKNHVEQFRKQENDTGYYSDFEELYNQLIASDAKDAGKPVAAVVPSNDEVQRLSFPRNFVFQEMGYNAPVNWKENRS